MKKLIMLSIVAAPFILPSCNNAATENKSSTKTDSSSVNKPVAKEVYTCPMDTDVHSDKPGKCPKCGMDLEKQTK